MFNGKIHYKLPFSIANCQITRGYLLNPSPTQLEVSPQPSRVPTDESVADLGGSCGGFLSMFPVLLPKRRSPIEHLDQYSLRFRLFVNEHPYTPANKCVYIYILYYTHVILYIHILYIWYIYTYFFPGTLDLPCCISGVFWEGPPADLTRRVLSHQLAELIA